MIGVSLDTDKKAFENAIAKNHIQWPQMFDGIGDAGALPRLFRAKAPPMNYIIDRDGRLAAVDVQAGRLAEVLAPLIGR